MTYRFTQPLVINTEATPRSSSMTRTEITPNKPTVRNVKPHRHLFCKVCHLTPNSSNLINASSRHTELKKRVITLPELKMPNLDSRNSRFLNNSLISLKSSESKRPSSSIKRQKEEKVNEIGIPKDRTSSSDGSRSLLMPRRPLQIKTNTSRDNSLDNIRINQKSARATFTPQPSLKRALAQAFMPKTMQSRPTSILKKRNSQNVSFSSQNRSFSVEKSVQFML